MLKEQISTLGGYELEELIDHGEIGDVYRAYSAALERTVALTLIHEPLAQDPSFRASFRFQSATVRALRSPFCAEVVDTGIYGSVCFVAMEWLGHGTLHDMLEAGSAQDLSVAARVGLIWQAAKALEYAHSKDFIHGGLTPHSLFIAQPGDVPRIRVADFGAAWLAVHSDAAAALWSDSLIYAMPPERCQGVDMDQRCDIYALGMLLYTLLAGQPPFPVSSLDAAVFRHVYTQPLPLRQLNPEIPEALEQVVLQCVAKNRAERIASAAELAVALAPFAPRELFVPLVKAAPAAAESAVVVPVVVPLPVHSAEVEQTQPLGGIEHTQPLGGIEQTQPLGGIEQTQPLGGVEQTQPLGGVEQTQPLGGVEQTQPLADTKVVDVAHPAASSDFQAADSQQHIAALSESSESEQLQAQTASSEASTDPSPSAVLVDQEPVVATQMVPFVSPETPSVPPPASADEAVSALDFSLPDRKPLTPRPPLDAIGEVIAGYRLETYMGETETGHVYRAQYVETDTIAAVKIIRDDLAYEPFFVASFEEQVATLKSVRHPNLVQILDAGRVGDLCYIAMEWLPDGTLRNLLQRRGASAIPLRQGLDLVRQAAVGLEFLHAQRLIHGGVKPGSLMLVQYEGSQETDYTLKVSDVGFASIALNSIDEEQIWPDTLIYAMPPERCQGLELDHRADIYALGVILYELTTGSPPFEAKTLDSAIYRHVYTQPTPPRQLMPEIPAKLETIILQCLAKRPADRFPSMTALAEQLTVLLSSPAFAPRVQARPKLAVVASQPVLNEPFVARVNALDQYGRSIKTCDLTGEGLAIGRAAESDIVLQANSIAPQQIQVDWDGTTAIVTNVSQQDGVLMGDVPLPPQQSMPWRWETPIRVGPYWLRIEAVRIDMATPAANVATAIVEDVVPSLVRSTDAATLLDGTGETLSTRIAILLEQETLVLTPGKPAMFRLTLSNMGNTVDHFTVTAEGVSQKWLVGDPPMVQLNPGVQGSVTLNVLVPAVSENEAGDYPVNIRARSRENPLESNIAPMIWTVLPFLGSTFDMRPKRVKRRYKGRFRINIRNTGNTLTKYALTANDDEEALNYQFAQDIVEIKPGVTVKTDLYAWPLRRRWYGQSINHRFNVHMKTMGSDLDPISTPAQLEQIAMISRWWVGVLVVALMGCAAFMWWNARPQIVEFEPSPVKPMKNQPFMLNWQVQNATSLELKIKTDTRNIGPATPGVPVLGLGEATQMQLVARNLMLGYTEKTINVIPVIPTRTPTRTPTPTLSPTPTTAPTLTPTIPPTTTPVPPTLTPTPIPSPTSQTLCMAGSTSDIIVTGKKRESYLVNFNGRVISGGQLDDKGWGIIHLGPFHELPGTYKVEVRSRITGRLLLGVNCIVP